MTGSSTFFLEELAILPVPCESVCPWKEVFAASPLFFGFPFRLWASLGTLGWWSWVPCFRLTRVNGGMPDKVPGWQG